MEEEEDKFRPSSTSCLPPDIQQNGTGRHEPSEQDVDMNDIDEKELHLGGSLGLSDEEDYVSRRELRYQYRQLISSVYQNREDFLSLTSNKLVEALHEADRLFVQVSQAREAVLDSHFLVMASDLGRERANQLQVEGATFDPSVYVEHLLTFMGLNRVEEDSDEEGVSGGYLPQVAWQTLGLKSQECFSSAPSFHFMLGSFTAEPPTHRRRVQRQRKASDMNVKAVMPTVVKKMDNSQQEATEKEVERILGFLQQYHEEDPDSPLTYFEFVIDPKSFSKTVENIFHLSFLIRDGLAMMYLDTDKVPYIAPVQQGQTGEGSGHQQCVISLSHTDWKEIIEAFDIREALINAPSHAHQQSDTMEVQEGM